MIDLDRRSTGRLIRVGHRGAAGLAPENTLRAFRAAVEVGVDLVEFDVLDLPRGPLVLAHSDSLAEVSHGAAKGSVRSRSLAQLRAVAPELPTLDEALRFFAEEAPQVGLHVDLKLTTRVDELSEALVRFGLEGRTVVSSFNLQSLQVVATNAPSIRLGFTYPEDKLGVSGRSALQPFVGVGVFAARRVVPRRLPRMVRHAGATTLMLHHRLATRSSVKRVKEMGVSVLAWTVDDPKVLERVVATGVDGVITNDPRIFSTLEE